MSDASATGLAVETHEQDDDTHVGSSVPRREDRALLTGEATFTDDSREPDMTFLAFVRSEDAHARITNIETSDATEMDGILAVYTWNDIAASDAPGTIPVATSQLDYPLPGHPILARDRVRYHGQPIAAVVATDRYLARDGVEAITVVTEPLTPVVDPEEATNRDAPVLFDDAQSNVIKTSELGNADSTKRALDRADHVISLDIENNRLIPSALEPRAALAQWDAATSELTVEMTSQAPHSHRRKLAKTLGMPERRIRVVSPSVGGGFGHKGHHHPGEAMAAWSAMRLGRPVKWTATRSENYLAGAHGRDHRTSAELAIDDDGTLRGLRAETVANVGSYGLGIGPLMPGWYGTLLSGQYDIDEIYCETMAVVTNTAPVHSYRGAGRPEALYVTERLLDTAARELGFDPATLRRQNLLDTDQFPYETPVGAEYDSGDYEAAFQKALDAVDYADRRRKGSVGAGPDADGRYRGIGIGSYVESTGHGFESALVRVHPDGSVTVYVGSHSHGQGHQTTYAQIVADELGISPETIEVREGDTERVPTGTGTFGSRSAITGGNAVRESCLAIREKAIEIAASLLDGEPGDVNVDDGVFEVSGDDATQVPFEDVAETAYRSPEVEIGLEETRFFRADASAYTFGTHVALVAVDPDTGKLDIERYIAVDDCGNRINPPIIDGQVHGAVAQGIGQARSELTVYDDDGSLITDTMLDYGIPRASHIPTIETDETITPSPHNPMGVKGIGEAGTIAAPPALVNAVVDALAPLGVRNIDMPVTDETIWRAIHGGPGSQPEN